VRPVASATSRTHPVRPAWSGTSPDITRITDQPSRPGTGPRRALGRSRTRRRGGRRSRARGSGPRRRRGSGSRDSGGPARTGTRPGAPRSEGSPSRRGRAPRAGAGRRERATGRWSRGTAGGSGAASQRGGVAGLPEPAKATPRHVRPASERKPTRRTRAPDSRSEERMTIGCRGSGRPPSPSGALAARRSRRSCPRTVVA
jgi:hypothetical protein